MNDIRQRQPDIAQHMRHTDIQKDKGQSQGGINFYGCRILFHSFFLSLHMKRAVIPGILNNCQNLRQLDFMRVCFHCCRICDKVDADSGYSFRFIQCMLQRCAAGRTGHSIHIDAICLLRFLQQREAGLFHCRCPRLEILFRKCNAHGIHYQIHTRLLNFLKAAQYPLYSCTAGGTMHALNTIGLLLGSIALLHMKAALFHSLHGRFFVKAVREADHRFFHNQIYGSILYRRLTLQYFFYRGCTC